MVRTTVLLVEDNMVQRFMNERILHKAGYTVVHAADGDEALRMACEGLPDLILLDLLLPGLGGRRVLLALKDNPATAEIPILILSGLPKSNETKLRKEGAAGYFEKSRLVEDHDGEKDMLTLIDEILRNSKPQDKAKAQTNSSTG
ncbi:MAG: response regulator [Terriglobales bacterium]